MPEIRNPAKLKSEPAQRPTGGFRLSHGSHAWSECGTYCDLSSALQDRAFPK